MNDMSLAGRLNYLSHVHNARINSYQQQATHNHDRRTASFKCALMSEVKWAHGYVVGYPDRLWHCCFVGTWEELWIVVGPKSTGRSTVAIPLGRDGSLIKAVRVVGWAIRATSARSVCCSHPHKVFLAIVRLVRAFSNWTPFLWSMQRSRKATTAVVSQPCEDSCNYTSHSRSVHSKQSHMLLDPIAWNAC